MELHREKGANLDVDVSYHYLKFMIDDDAAVEEIGRKYGKGEMLTSEVKEILINEVQKTVREHNERKSKITDEELKEWMTPRPLKLFADGVVPHEDAFPKEPTPAGGEKKKEKKEKKQGEKPTENSKAKPSEQAKTEVVPKQESQPAKAE